MHEPNSIEISSKYCKPIWEQRKREEFVFSISEDEN